MNRLPPLLLALALIVTATVIVATMGLLRPIVPSHMRLDGRVDRWTPRDMYVAMMLAIGIGVPLLIVASTALTRRLPPRWINLPHREYWLAPERRERTHATLHDFSCAIGTVVALFVAALHLLIVSGGSARGAPPQPAFYVLLGVLVATLLGMVAWLLRRFCRPG
ncbi:MAG TPA: hypothetical protein VGI14_13885 [Casimicrobiaceae bacterium]|jgi:hypothetical protein